MGIEAGPDPLLVLLPGLDGAGRRLSGFTAALAGAVDCRILAYPAARETSYAELQEILRPSLPRDRPFALLGESFGGPLALRIAAASPPGLQALVLVNSFARSPYPWLQAIIPLAARAPVKALPRWLRARLLWGAPAAAVPVQGDRATSAVPRSVLRSRLRALLAADERAGLAGLAVPVLALRGRRDRLVPRRAMLELLSLAPHAQFVEMDGQHLLLQTRAVECASVVAMFVLEQAKRSALRTGAAAPDAN